MSGIAAGFIYTFVCVLPIHLFTSLIAKLTGLWIMPKGVSTTLLKATGS